jgi:hypothetical protein
MAVDDSGRRTHRPEGEAVKVEKETFANHLLSLPPWTDEEFEREAARAYHTLEVNFDVEGRRRANEKIVIFQVSPSYGPVLPEALFPPDSPLFKTAREFHQRARSSNGRSSWYAAWGHYAHIFDIGPAGILGGYFFVGAEPVKVRDCANACYKDGPDVETSYQEPD